MLIINLPRLHAKLVYNTFMDTDIDKLQNSSFVKKIENFAVEKGLLSCGDKIIVALSGGADSVALLLALICLKEKYKLCIEAFHLNHNIRVTAPRDENFCRELCDNLGIKIRVYSRNIPAESKKLKVSEETAGRLARYEIMESLKDDFTKAATAHHADDNSETLLMHLIRGCGVRGLCGIPALKGNFVIRPLLCVTKDEIFAFVEACGCGYVTDETNFQNEYFRNRIRNEFIPKLKEENPEIVKNLGFLSDIAASYCEIAEKAADDIQLSENNGTYRIKYEDVLNAPKAIRITMILKLCALCGADSDVSRESINDLERLISQSSRTVWSYSLHKTLFSRSYGEILVRSAGEASNELEEGFCYPLAKKNALFVFPKHKFALRIYETENFKKNGGNKHTTYIDYDKITDNISVRTKKEGDRFYPVGVDFSKSLKRFFIDRKIPAALRLKIPLLTDGGNIAAIIGREVDSRYAVGSDTKRIMAVELINMEEEYA